MITCLDIRERRSASLSATPRGQVLASQSADPIPIHSFSKQILRLVNGLPYLFRTCRGIDLLFSENFRHASSQSSPQYSMSFLLSLDFQSNSHNECRRYRLDKFHASDSLIEHIPDSILPSQIDHSSMIVFVEQLFE